jgi:phospholipase/carboxylesterase
MTQPLLNGPFFKTSQQPADYLVIFLHGYGANGDDLLNLGYEWRDTLPNTLFASPHAPFPCETGGGGYQWFSLQDWSTQKLLAGADTALPYVQAYIKHQQQQHGVASDKTFLVGFSQGAMMAIHTALASLEPLAGVVAYSGACLWPENRPCSDKTPVLLVHGRQDDVVPIEACDHAKNCLNTLKVRCDAHKLDGLAHGINAAGIALARAFFTKQIGIVI